MDIRPPETDTDIVELIRAHGRAWREAYDDVLPDPVLDEVTVEPTPEEVEEWAEGLDGDCAATFVAVIDGTVRGFVDVRWGDDNTKPFVGIGEAGLKAIYVHPDRWGEGIGTALLERGLDALPTDIDAIRLDAFADNESGARFYESRGFERAGVRAVEIADETYPLDVWVRSL
ncbi:GNAT family N-acetyltransferase [Halorubrum rubrum]|uniref:GNAT family N-acetyltransferase n=1 Tax=Halorubrum rubrum TaxID=1126240 RepID=A0ABD5R041_9EURY|nr:GNAT family N-acetyltransferase [Halorubrum rubrum]